MRKTRFQNNTDTRRSLQSGCALLPALLCAWIVFAAAGCMKVGPHYVPPATKTPPQWTSIPDPALLVGEETTRNWWTVFEDPFLVRLVEQAAAGNLDLKTAVARVREARARLDVAAGGLFPEVDAQARVTRQRSSDNTGFFLGRTITNYVLGLDAGWEVDLFGRISRSIEAAAADYEASEEDRADVLVSVYAEIARNYLAVRTLQARLAATTGNIESQKQVLELTRSRFRYGLATDLDVAQAEDVLAASEAQVPPLRAELNQTLNNIALLLGEPPGALRGELSEVRPIPVPPSTIAVGIPADLLRQRPDIRRAERQLAAQTARIGVATADLYPSFSLVGSLGLESIDTSDLFNAGSHFYTFGPRLFWNVFDAGRIRARIRVADALTEQALHQYEQTVLRALSEVETAMSTYAEERNRLQALERSVAASKRSLDLAVQLYKEGLRDFQSVLDAQRSLFDQENQMAQSRGNIAIDVVLLYRALGGGWQPQDPPEPFEASL